MMISIRTRTSLLLVLFLGTGMFSGRAHAQANTQSTAAPGPPAAHSDTPSWLFPIEKLDEVMPSWLHIGGEDPSRPRRPTGMGRENTRALYLPHPSPLDTALRPMER